MSDRESTGEVSPKAFDTAQFDRIFKKHFRHQKLYFKGGERIEFPRHRALKKTFRELDEMELSNSELREIVQHLIKNKEYSGVFRGWVALQNKNWDTYLSAQNTHRIYALGRNELLRKVGKRANLG